MRQTAISRTTDPRLVRSTSVGLAILTTAIIGTLVAHSASSSAPSLGSGYPSGGQQLRTPQSGSSAPESAPGFAEPRGARWAAPTEPDVGLTEEDGVLPDGVTVFDDEYPGIANLDPGLLRELRAAARAAGDGITFTVNSGWRSPAYQDRLLRAAVSRYGSERAAERWVATADTSPHVAGKAVDIGSGAAIAWLSKRGVRYGLCQIYRNEPWHFELRVNAVARGCPSMYADPTHDPRMG